MIKPDIVFITSKLCGHCRTFRGTNGIPSPKLNWNYNYIKKLLNDASKIIEIHTSSLSNNDNNIIGINIYQKNSFNIIERLSIKRGGFDIVTFEFNYEPYETFKYDLKSIEIMKKEYENMYFWNLIPKDIYNTYKKQIKNMDNNKLKFYEQEIKQKYNYSYILDFIISPTIRNYEIFYPCWMLIKHNAINDDNVYARVINNITNKKNGKIELTFFSGSETIETLLQQYKDNKLKLDFNDNKELPKFSWQKNRDL